MDGYYFHVKFFLIHVSMEYDIESLVLSSLGPLHTLSDHEVVHDSMMNPHMRREVVAPIVVNKRKWGMTTMTSAVRLI